MASFGVGTLLISTTHNYSITNCSSLSIVKATDLSTTDDIYVTILATVDDVNQADDGSWWVKSDNFREITYREYFKMFPQAQLCEGNIRQLNANGFNIDIESLRPSAEDALELVPYELSESKMSALVQEITTLLEEYDYRPTDHGVRTLLAEYLKNKAPLIRRFEKHPNYNGKFQIVYDYDFTRACDRGAVKNILRDVFFDDDEVKAIFFENHELTIDGMNYAECYAKYQQFDRMSILCDTHSWITNINNMSYEDIRKKCTQYKSLVFRLRSTGHCVDYNENVICVDLGAWDAYNRYQKAIGILWGFYENKITSEIAAELNDCRPDLKAVAGQKTSRVLNKICKLFGVDKLKWYNREFAKYSDAINPLTIKRHTILSVHPVDYLTMSFGNSWASCHTIDKKNYRGMENDYSGCYSGGTESYMLDGTSMVFYTVDADYNGNEYELQPKINRNMFHYGYDKLVQGRVYPQCNDDEGGIYTRFREIVQQIMATCADKPNSWLLVKGTEECTRNIISRGVHYRDYASFDNCNVSYLGKTKTAIRLTVGHNPICPCCGKTHRAEDIIECGACYSQHE